MKHVGISWVVVTTLLTATALALAACGGGGGGGTPPAPPPTGMKISGEVLQPSAETMLRVGKLGALAPTTLLEPAPNATVELWEVDDDGDLIGVEPIATTMASLTGSWQFTLPVGMDLNAKLVVRVVLASGTMRGQVVTEFVTISPLSEFILQTLTSDGNDLGNVSPNDVITLKGYVEQADISKALDTGAVDEAIMALNEQFGDDTGYDSLLDQSQQPAGDATTATGQYWYADIGTQINSFGYSLAGVETAEFDVVGYADGTGTATSLGATSLLVVQPFSNPPPTAFTYNLQWLLEIEGPDAFGGTFSQNADGSIVVLEPFEEDICDDLSPCAGTGWRYPENTVTFCPVSQAPENGVYAAVTTERGVQYGLTGDGVIDTTNPLGVEVSYYVELLAKKGLVPNTTIDGKVYGVLTFGQWMAAGGPRSAIVGLAALQPTATGPGAGTLAHESAELGLHRIPNAPPPSATVAWENTGGDPNDPEPEEDAESGIPYTLDESTGEMTIGSGADQQKVFIGNGGDVLFWGHGEGENGIEGEVDFGVGVRLPTGEQPTVTAGSYKVLWMDLCYGEGGGTEITRSVAATIEFDPLLPPLQAVTGVVGPSLNLMGTGVFRTKMSDGDTDPDGGNDDLDLSGTWTWEDIGTPGLMTFSLTEDSDTIHGRGFMNFDGSFGVFGLWSSQLDGSHGDACVGIALLIRQPSTE